ncbi:hypothetical protein [Erythrobacter dokdonensis]|jgi:hypothetical protein|uniref:Uncharacterized protein n=1 Tax=Erythrobacter dokdonensis DSW-74 TaxID=1300349 RepID=A0A1A7BM35_9SPHN|nr:hypothetical protein [Erythrobacter dokdonensis]MEE4316103.1 hypothetical protein [Erythrobacter sp.]OBV12532.1 hypothetical protein I603_0663 [Erythrobacter dokdonensis DSW-74]
MMVLRAAGLFLIVMGTIWALQGAGLLAWPADSFMLADSSWIARGLITAVAGMGMLWWALRRGRS